MDKFAIPKKNIVLIIVGLAVILLGYILIMGGGAENPETFNEDLFSVRRMYVAPVVIILGFAIEVYAILKKPKRS